MKIKRFLINFLHTFLPNKYRKHTEKPVRAAFELYISVLFIGAILSFLIFIPVLKSQSDNVVDVVSDFKELNLTFNVKTLNPVTLVNHPSVILDTNASERGDATYLISDDTIFYKKNLFKEGERNFTSSIDLISKQDELEKWFFILALIFLPAYVLGMGLSLFLGGLILSLILAYVAKLVFKKKDYSYRDCFMVCLHAMIPGLFIFLIGLPFYNLWLVSIGLFLILSILSLFIMKGYKFESFSAEE